MAKRKSFEEKNKFIHSSRKKIIDTIYGREDNTKGTFGYEAAKEKRNVGDVWEDEYWRYEQKDGYISKTGKNHEVYQEIRDYLKSKSECQNSECEKQKFGPTDKALISQTGFCVDCLITMESEVKRIGLWEEYEKWRMFAKAIGIAKDAKQQIQQGIKELKPFYENVYENGMIEKWHLPKPMEEMQKDMENEIENIDKGLQELEEDIVLHEKRLREANNVQINKLMNGSSK